MRRGPSSLSQSRITSGVTLFKGLVLRTHCAIAIAIAISIAIASQSLLLLSTEEMTTHGDLSLSCFLNFQFEYMMLLSK